MKRSLPVLLLIGFAIFGLSQTAITSSSGSPTGRSGSPASNNRTCQASGCHSGPSQSTEAITISTDIPASGFQENTDYTITISGDANGGVGTRIGFAASVEDASGNHMGTLTTADSRTQVSNNYATHRSTSLSATNGQNSWDLNWNSGSAVDGTTIYVSMNFTNGNGSTSGDVVVTNTLSLSKASGVSLEENSLNELALFPNPATDFTSMRFSLPQSEELTYSIIDLNGKVVASENIGQYGTGEHTVRVPLVNLARGVYTMHMTAGNNVYTERFTVR